MFRLEKVFQNDDSGYILFTSVLKLILIFSSIYVFLILNKNTVYDLLNYKIFIESKFFLFSVLFVSYLTISIFFNGNKREYKSNFISFIREDILNFFVANIFTLATLFILNNENIFGLEFLYLSIYIVFISAILKIIFNNIYNSLIEKNIIQKNIMLVGTIDEIREILKNSFEKIYIFKCCMITNLENQEKKFLRSEIKFPIFNINEDIRSILEYHSLGQIWILNGDNKNKEDILSKIFKYSVDTLNIKLTKSQNLRGKKLLANKFDYEYYEMSRFYGINLFLKILLDKILSLIFILIVSPILLLSAIAIYLEDGLPILFTQNRTGWDGRRFKIYKLRSLKKTSFDKTKQVTKDDNRLLKLGRILRRYSIDELPQFFNVLNGDMSIVGPRPHMVEHDIHYSSLFNNFLKRHKCNPGLTGWAQVNGLRGATPNPDVMKRRMEFDLWYLNNWSIFLDLYIILKTFYALFKYKGD